MSKVGVIVDAEAEARVVEGVAYDWLFVSSGEQSRAGGREIVGRTAIVRAGSKHRSGAA